MNLVKWPQTLAFTLSTQVAQAQTLVIAEAEHSSPSSLLQGSLMDNASS